MPRQPRLWSQYATYAYELPVAVVETIGVKGTEYGAQALHTEDIPWLRHGFTPYSR